LNFSIKPLPQLLDQIEGYGCWCRLNPNTHGQGKAKPVDWLDELCKNLHNSINCLKKDFGDACNPWSVSYNTIYKEDLSVDCESGNLGSESNDFIDQASSECRIAICKIESTFVEKFYQERHLKNKIINQSRIILYNPNSPKYDKNGLWDPKTSCTIPKFRKLLSKPVTFEESCCGNYPNRRPFRSVVFDEGTGEVIKNRECCVGKVGYGSKVFDPVLHECFEGEVVDIGV